MNNLPSRSVDRSRAISVQLHPVEILLRILAIGALIWFFVFTGLITAKYLDLIPSTTTGVRK